jgi:hypothetical protein
VLIVDAGGGTIDLSAYSCASGSADSFEEIAPPQCELARNFGSPLFLMFIVAGHFNGSIFVTFNARAYLEGEASRYVF